MKATRTNNTWKGTYKGHRFSIVRWCSYNSNYYYVYIDDVEFLDSHLTVGSAKEFIRNQVNQ